jgi:DNA-binding transcriptional regulator YiaG
MQRHAAQPVLGQLLGITHRTIRVIHDHSGGRFSSRKLIPVNPKTTGDYLLLKRIKANLSQPEVALKAGVSEQMVRAWEHDQSLPTEAQWQVLAGKSNTFG